MYAEEETELRDLVIQNLENCGFLNKIKAELRAGVFLALEEDGSLRKKIPLFNKKFDDFIETAEGKLTVSIVREFLEYFNLHFTLSVFDPETASNMPFLTRSDLCGKFKLENDEFEGPVLVTLIKENFLSIDDLLNPSFATSSSDTAGKQISTTISNSTEKNAANKEKLVSDDLKCFKEDVVESHMMEESNLSNTFIKENTDNIFARSDLQNKDSDIEKSEKNDSGEGKKEKPNISNICKESMNVLSVDHDPFFDEPLPSEKLYFSFPSENKNGSAGLRDNSQNKISSLQNDSATNEKHSLSSLKNLPSLTGGSDWTFTREPKSMLPSLDLIKSVSNVENSNEDKTNLNTEGSLLKNNSDVIESNEESSDKHLNSEDSIEEEIEEDFSAGIDDLLNSSLSLGDDVTTDQSVSQVSVVEGVDHVETVNLVQ